MEIIVIIKNKRIFNKLSINLIILKIRIAIRKQKYKCRSNKKTLI